MIACLILDLPFTHVENTYCVDENHIEDYMFLQEAKAACSNDSECTMIFDNLCDNYDLPNDQRIWTTCKGKGSFSDHGSCSLIKGIVYISFVHACLFDNIFKHHKPSFQFHVYHFFVGCFVADQEYSPLDMSGQGVSVEASASHCQNRCLNTDGCAYFTYRAEDGSCHLQDSSSTPEESSNAISGPARCPTGSHELK